MRRRTPELAGSGLARFLFFVIERKWVVRTVRPLEFGFVALEIRVVDRSKEVPIANRVTGTAVLRWRFLDVEESDC